MIASTSSKCLNTQNKRGSLIPGVTNGGLLHVSKHVSKRESMNVSKSIERARSQNRGSVVSRVGPRDGGALLERNVIININISFEPFYRVILYYSNWDDDKTTALKITNAVSIVDFNAATKIVQNAKSHGKAIVVTVIKDDAVLYMNNLKNKGLDVSIDEA